MKTENHYLIDQLEERASIFFPGMGEVISFPGGSITLKVTSDISNDQLGVYEISLDPGAIGAKLHYHRFMDETFIVREGLLTIELIDRQVELAAGGVAYAPRFTAHGFRNTSDSQVTFNLLFNPGQKREGFFFGLEEILNDVEVDPEKYLRLYQKYDSYPVDTADMLPLTS